jgi:uronate dehydrogenase
LSYDDLIELVRCALFTPRVDHSIIYGVSDNTVKWWDNARAAHLGFHARDSSRRFEDRFPASGPMDSAPEHVFQGGPWVLSEPLEP